MMKAKKTMLKVTGDLYMYREATFPRGMYYLVYAPMGWKVARFSNFSKNKIADLATLLQNNRLDDPNYWKAMSRTQNGLFNIGTRLTDALKKSDFEAAILI